MRSKIVVSGILLLNAFVGLAHADQNRGFYLGANLSYVDSDSIVSANATRNSISLPAAELLAGFKYNNWLGLDLRYGLGGVDRDVSTAIAGEQINYSIGDYQSFYLRSEILNSEAKLYFLLGYSQIDADEEQQFTGAANTKSSVSASGPSYGIGAGWYLENNFNINIEYRAIVDDDDMEFNAISLGLDYRFKNSSLKFW